MSYNTPTVFISVPVGYPRARRSARIVSVQGNTIHLYVPSTQSRTGRCIVLAMTVVVRRQDILEQDRAKLAAYEAPIKAQAGPWGGWGATA